MSRTHTDADYSEQTGSAIATNCLNVILNAPTRAESVAALQTALLELKRLPHPKRAAGGFAVALVATLGCGIGAQL